MFVGLVFIIVGLYRGRPKRYILYLSDIHYDNSYLSNGSPKEKCRNSTGTSRSFKFGQYKCDTPKALLDLLYDFLPTVAPRPKLIIFGGDLSSSSATDDSFEAVLNNIKEFKETMNNLYPDVPVLFNLGNREYPNNFGNATSDKETFAKIHEILKQYIDASKSSASFLKS